MNWSDLYLGSGLGTRPCSLFESRTRKDEIQVLAMQVGDLLIRSCGLHSGIVQSCLQLDLKRQTFFHSSQRVISQSPICLNMIHRGRIM